MRIAVVSDIHGNLPALEAVVRDFTRRGVDLVVNLGDSVSGPLLPRETAQFLMARAADDGWVHLAGNHERQILTQGPNERGPSDEYAHAQLDPQALTWLAGLRPSAALSPEVFLCHGTPTSDVEYFLETVTPGQVRAASGSEIDARLGAVDAALVVCGHTHVPRCARSARGQLIVNPGSVGLPAYDSLHPHPHVVENGSPDARYAIVEKIGGAWLPSLIAVPYRHGEMVALAHARQRPDWTCALATGYMDKAAS
jgi:predicted phosphodiesterase